MCVIVQHLLLAFALVLTFISPGLLEQPTTTTERNDCSSVKNAWVGLGQNGDMVPPSYVPGGQLQICSTPELTCCTPVMETRLLLRGQTNVSTTLADSLRHTGQSLDTAANQFRSFYLDLLDRSSADLNSMFTQTYGQLYEQNSQIFDTLYSDLRAFLTGSDIDLSGVMDSFFASLMLRMFRLLNAQYSLTDVNGYLSCVRSSFDSLVPFGDAPQKLGVQVKRSLIAARTFYQGLTVGREVCDNVMKVELTMPCVSAVTRMLHCPVCRGLTDIRPCADYCRNVMRGCLVYHAKLNDAWNDYIEALLKVTQRLEGSFNIENVVMPMNVKISDAIMNFQDNADAVTNKVFQLCGQPSVSGHRRQRSIESEYLGMLEWNPPSHHVDISVGSSMDSRQLIHDIRDQLVTTNNFWKTLPESTCKHLASTLFELTNCWNGQDRSRYVSQVVDLSLAGQANNPELTVDPQHSDAVIDRQIIQLKSISHKLMSAFNGLYVDWIDISAPVDDDEDISDDGSGDDDDDEIDYSASGEVDSGDHDQSWVNDPLVVDPGISFDKFTYAPVEVVTRRTYEYADRVTAKFPVSTASVVISQCRLSCLLVTFIPLLF